MKREDFIKQEILNKVNIIDGDDIYYVSVVMYERIESCNNKPYNYILSYAICDIHGNKLWARKIEYQQSPFHFASNEYDIVFNLDYIFNEYKKSIKFRNEINHFKFNGEEMDVIYNGGEQKDELD